jgi:hypothetical protein
MTGWRGTLETTVELRKRKGMQGGQQHQLLTVRQPDSGLTYNAGSSSCCQAQGTNAQDSLGNAGVLELQRGQDKGKEASKVRNAHLLGDSSTVVNAGS